MNNQFATRRLLTEEEVIFTINDSSVDQLLHDKFTKQFDQVDQMGDIYYSMDRSDYERFLDAVSSGGYDIENDVVEKSGMHEDGMGGGSTSSGAGAYNPSLHATKKKYQGPEYKAEVKDKEPKLAAGKAKNYVKDKWDWKAAPSIPNRPSKGGFIYKDLWEEAPKKISLDDYLNKLSFTKDQIKNIKGLYSDRSKSEHSIRIQLAKLVGAEKAKQVQKWYSNDGYLNENYSKFKKETRLRDESQQYHEAMKLVRKKMEEVNKILEYSARLKEEFPYQNTGMHETKTQTKKAIEKIKMKVAEAYKKIKKLEN